MDRAESPRARAVRTPQQARSRRTRDAVLQAAVECFENHGWDGTTTAMIAEEAGVAVGTLYGYFKDKRDIVLELLEGTIVELQEHLIRSLQFEARQDRDPREVLRQLIDDIFHAHTLSPGMQRIVWERFFKDDAFRDAQNTLRERVMAAIVAFLEPLREQGLLHDIDLEAAAFVIHSSVQWTASQAHQGDCPIDDIDTVASHCADMLARFLIVDPA